ncbi:MAG TPA: FG-GAP-like repeat-containing protein [Thermoanaerobaculia bacterium]|jgi:hypothetical protein
MKTLALLAVLAIAAPLSADCPSVRWVEQASASADVPVYDIRAVDFNGDGDDDLVTFEDDATSKRHLYTRRSNGDGTFQEKVHLAEGVYFNYAAGDVDGDGHPELLAANGSTVEIFPGTGSGFSTDRTYLGSGDNVRALDFGNFDADPALELVTGGSALVYYDNVNGAFVERARTAITSQVIDVAAGDFDGDGRVDVAVNSWNPMRIQVFFRNAGATFTAPLNLTPGTQPQRVDAGDVNGDGKAELAVADWEDTNITLFRPSGTRQFTSTPFSLHKPNALAWGAGVELRDVSGDGKEDLLGTTPNGHWLVTWISAGDGTFLTPSFTDGAGAMGFAVGDFDGDGVLNVASAPFGSLRTFTLSCTPQVLGWTRAELISAGDPAVLRAAIVGFPTVPPQNRGTVTFRKGTTVLGVVDVDAAGKAGPLSVPGLAVGEHVLTAEFSGNAAVAAATSEPFTQTVTNDRNTLELLTEGQPVHGTPWPVEIRLNDGVEVFVDVEVDGVHQLFYTGHNPLKLVLNAGPHTLNVFYEGNSFSPGAEAVLSFTTAKATPSIASSGALTVRAGTAHALQFTLAGPAGAAPPAGTVTLTENGTVRGSATLANGVATINATFPRGVHKVRATYGGNANFESVFVDLTLQVTPNFPLAIEARGIPGAIHIGYSLWPDINPDSLKLYRRVYGSADWLWLSSWSRANGLDLAAAVGVTYEYRLDGQLTSGSPINSNMDTALRFTDDPLAAGMTVRHAHFKELRAAVNLLRQEAGQSPFNFEAGFETQKIIRASHVNALRTALNETRARLGMETISFGPAIVAGGRIKASEVLAVRDGAR